MHRIVVCVSMLLHARRRGPSLRLRRAALSKDQLSCRQHAYNVPMRSNAALRLARSAPQFPLSSVAAAADVSLRRLNTKLAALPARGVCAQAVAARTAGSAHSRTRRRAIKHGACPPPAARRAGSDRAFAVRESVPGTAGWSSRSSLIHPWLHRAELTRSAVTRPDPGPMHVAQNAACPPALLLALIESADPDTRRLIARRCEDATVCALLGQDSDPQIREHLARNPACPPMFAAPRS